MTPTRTDARRAHERAVRAARAEYQALVLAAFDAYRASPEDASLDAERWEAYNDAMDDARAALDDELAALDAKLAAETEDAKESGETPRRTLRIPDADWSALRAYADSQSRTVTDVVLTAIRQVLAEAEK